MKTTVVKHRKLIDVKPYVFDALSLEAAREGVSLKKYIEDLLERSCRKPASGKSSGIARLIGSAIPRDKDISSIEDDRLKYLLSK